MAALPGPATIVMSFLRRAHIPWITAALGVLITLVAYHFTSRAEEAGTRAEFERRSQVIANTIDLSLRMHEDTLYNLRTLFHYSTEVSREEFAGAADELVRRHAGIQALEWIARVPGSRRALTEAAVRAEGFPAFEFSDRGEGAALKRAPDRPEHFPVLYVHPFQPNRAALGFDLVSGRTWPDLQRAARDNTLVASGRLPLITDGQRTDWGYLFELPVYRLPVPEKEPARQEALRGFVLGIFRLDDVINTSLSQIDPHAGGLDLLILDRRAPTDRQFLHYRPAEAVPGRPVPSTAEFKESPLHRVILLAVPGRSWEVHFRASSGWLARQRHFDSLLVLIAGLAGTLLISGYLRAVLRRTELVEREVAVRTTELRDTQKLLEDDIRHREVAERALKASQSHLQAILDHSPNAIFVKDLAGRYVLVNLQYEKMWNRSARQIIGRTDPEVYPAELAARFQETDQRALASGAPISFDVSIAPVGRSTQTSAIVRKSPLRDADGRVYGICGISTDITERKQAEAELQENRRQLDNLISQLPGAAFRCKFDENLTMLFASEGMLALTGHPAEDFLAGRVFLPQLTVPADRPAVRGAVAAAIKERRPFEIEYRLFHRDGQEKWVLVRGRPIYDENGALRFLEGLAIDVTALKLAEQEKLAIERKLLAAQKLESLGVLAGGIAHDFNNILTSVLANASLARHDAAAGQPVERNLQQIELAARRAADLCQQMLAYAGKGKLATDRLDLSELVRGTAALLEVTISKNTRLDLRLADGLPPVLADPTQLRQIVMNLVLNAADAITDRPGLITITTFTRAADAAVLRSALGSPDLPPGTYAGLEVTDNGSGMTPETLARIFEPFFTTKFSGRGLGLSAVLGIVQGHRGALFVESSPGQGSTFRLLLPATSGQTVSSAPPFPAPAGRVALRGTVLVVDDEEAVRSIAATVLEIHGATSLTAANGDEGLELLRTHGEKICLVLLDLTMPGITGEETLRRMRMLGARQPVILMSGYSETETMQRSTNLGVAGFIQKPFEVATMLARVKPFLA